MAKRYSGRAVVTVLYDDRRSDYKATVAIGKRNVWSGRIGEPKSRTIAVDSPKAYDSAAHAALSFAADANSDVDNAAELSTSLGSTWHIGRSKATARMPLRRANPARKAGCQCHANPSRALLSLPTSGPRTPAQRARARAMKSPDVRFRLYNISVKRSGRWVPVEGNTGRGTDHTLAGVKRAYLAKHPSLKSASVKVEREKRGLRAAMSPSKRMSAVRRKKGR